MMFLRTAELTSAKLQMINCEGVRAHVTVDKVDITVIGLLYTALRKLVFVNIIAKSGVHLSLPELCMG